MLLLLAMAEEKQILLDRKVLSLDLESVRKFAIQAKVDESDLEGKGKLDIIRAIRRKVEDSVNKLHGDDQIEYLDGLMIHLGPPPLEGMEDKYGDPETEMKEKLDKLKTELTELESKKKATVQEGKSASSGDDSDTIKIPLLGVQQTILRRDFKIQGVVGDPGQKDKLGYQALMSQIEAGIAKGYSDKEVVSAVVRAVQPGLQLRSYLENTVELTLPKLRKIIRFHFHEKNATELYQLLTNLAQEPKEDPPSFLMRALTIRQKIISASKESGTGIKYDASSVQSLFLHALETGLADETIRAKIRPLTQNPSVADEDLIEAMSLAMSAETERSHKFGLSSKTKSVKVSTVEGGVDARVKKDQELLATLKAVQADLATVQSEMKTLRSTVTASSKPPTGFNHNGNRVEPRQVGCRVCREKGEGDKCSHCYLCGGLNHIARYCRTKFNNQQGNGRRLPPRDRE